MSAQAAGLGTIATTKQKPQRGALISLPPSRRRTQETSRTFAPTALAQRANQQPSKVAPKATERRAVVPIVSSVRPWPNVKPCQPSLAQRANLCQPRPQAWVPGTPKTKAPTGRTNSHKLLRAPRVSKRCPHISRRRPRHVNKEIFTQLWNEGIEIRKMTIAFIRAMILPRGGVRTLGKPTSWSSRV